MLLTSSGHHSQQGGSLEFFDGIFRSENNTLNDLIFATDVWLVYKVYIFSVAEGFLEDTDGAETHILILIQD